MKYEYDSVLYKPENSGKSKAKKKSFGILPKWAEWDAVEMKIFSWFLYTRLYAFETTYDCRLFFLRSFHSRALYLCVREAVDYKYSHWDVIRSIKEFLFGFCVAIVAKAKLKKKKLRICMRWYARMSTKTTENKNMCDRNIGVKICRTIFNTFRFLSILSTTTTTINGSTQKESIVDRMTKMRQKNENKCKGKIPSNDVKNFIQSSIDENVSEKNLVLEVIRMCYYLSGSRDAITKYRK